MTGTLTDQLHEVGVPCRALVEWTACGNGRKDRCEKCYLDGPEKCDLQVVEALVARIVKATRQTDEALAQRDYWRGVAARIAETCMARERAAEEES